MVGREQAAADAVPAANMPWALLLTV